MLDAISRAPWLGYGWNEMSVAQSLVAPDHPAVREMVDHSHNMLLDLMVWNGVPLGLLMFGVFVWWFWRHLRACSDVCLRVPARHRCWSFSPTPHSNIR